MQLIYAQRTVSLKIHIQADEELLFWMEQVETDRLFQQHSSFQLSTIVEYLQLISFSFFYKAFWQITQDIGKLKVFCHFLTKINPGLKTDFHFDISV